MKGFLFLSVWVMDDLFATTNNRGPKPNKKRNGLGDGLTKRDPAAAMCAATLGWGWETRGPLTALLVRRRNSFVGWRSLRAKNEVHVQSSCCRPLGATATEILHQYNMTSEQ